MKHYFGTDDKVREVICKDYQHLYRAFRGYMMGRGYDVYRVSPNESVYWRVEHGIPILYVTFEVYDAIYKNKNT